MKKINVLFLVFTVVLLFLMSACGSADNTNAKTENDAQTPEVVEQESEPQDSLVEAVVSDEFKAAMDGYESWFDHYVEVMQEYKSNPQDLELMSEVTKLMSEEVTMLDEFNNLDQSGWNTAETAYYLEVSARIQQKLASVIS